jgi:hypothetical protein
MEDDRSTPRRDLVGPLIIAAAIVLTGAATMFTIMRGIDSAKEEIIEAATATPTPLDPFEVHERIESDSTASFEEAIESSLTDAALAEESYRVQYGEYTTSILDLEAEGLELHPDVTIAMLTDIDRSYCIQATHANVPGRIFYYDSEIGRVLEGPDGVTANCRGFE